MFDSLFSYFIFLIPLAIFIGRIVIQARSKNESSPGLPVHFEEEEEEDPAKKAQGGGKKTGDEEDDYSYALSRGTTEYPKGLAAQTPKPAPPVTQAGFTRSQLDPQSQAASMLAPAQENLALMNINHLSPLKQAVVMAEVLGPPKALRD